MVDSSEFLFAEQVCLYTDGLYHYYYSSKGLCLLPCFVKLKCVFSYTDDANKRALTNFWKRIALALLTTSVVIQLGLGAAILGKLQLQRCRQGALLNAGSWSKWHSLGKSLKINGACRPIRRYMPCELNQPISLNMTSFQSNAFGLFI